MSYTTEQLIQILDRELQATWRGERVLLSPAKRLNNSAVAKALDPGRLSKVFAYQDFRDQIHRYQHQHRVSGIIWRSCTFGGQAIYFPELHAQLVAVAGDREILMAAKESVLEFWYQATQGMSFWHAGDERQKTTLESIEQLSQQVEWAEVDAARTELYLRLCWGDPKECHYQWSQPVSGCERIIAAIAEPSSIKV